MRLSMRTFQTHLPSPQPDGALTSVLIDPLLRLTLVVEYK